MRKRRDSANVWRSAKYAHLFFPLPVHAVNGTHLIGRLMSSPPRNHKTYLASCMQEIPRNKGRVAESAAPPASYGANAACKGIKLTNTASPSNF